jgi:hypothetical protein
MPHLTESQKQALRGVTEAQPPDDDQTLEDLRKAVNEVVPEAIQGIKQQLYSLLSEPSAAAVLVKLFRSEDGLYTVPKALLYVCLERELNQWKPRSDKVFKQIEKLRA